MVFFRWHASSRGWIRSSWLYMWSINHWLPWAGAQRQVSKTWITLMSRMRTYILSVTFLILGWYNVPPCSFLNHIVKWDTENVSAHASNIYPNMPLTRWDDVKCGIMFLVEQIFHVAYLQFTLQIYIFHS